MKWQIDNVCLYFISVIFGEDVAFGGVFRCTVGLQDKYGNFYDILCFLILSSFFTFAVCFDYRSRSGI